MNDQNNNSNPSQATPDPVTTAPPAVPQAPEPVAAAPSLEPNKDLQALSQDLENLAKEAVATAPPAPSAAPTPVVSVPAAEPVVVPAAPVAPAPVVSPSSEPEPKPEEKEVVKEVAKEAPITIYITPACPFCKAEKELLASLNLAYIEKNVEEDTESLKAMLSVSDNFAGVPVTVLNGPKGKKVVKGFTKEEFVKELEAVGLKEASVEPAKTADSPVPEPVPAVAVPEVKEPVVAPPDAAPVAPAVPTAEEPKVPDLN